MNMAYLKHINIQDPPPQTQVRQKVFEETEIQILGANVDLQQGKLPPGT